MVLLILLVYILLFSLLRIIGKVPQNSLILSFKISCRFFLPLASTHTCTHTHACAHTHAHTHTSLGPWVIIVQWLWSACCHLYPIKNILTSAHNRTLTKSLALYFTHTRTCTLSSSPLTRPPLSTICSPQFHTCGLVLPFPSVFFAFCW